MKVNNGINNMKEKKLINQTNDLPETSELVELLYDDIHQDDYSSSVLSNKGVIEKYINLNKKKLTDEEWNKIFLKVKCKTGFTNSFSFKVADQLNIIHETKYEDVQKEIENLENFINSQEKNITSIEQQLNLNFNSKTQKEITKLAKSNVREAYSQMDGLLELVQDVVFNIEVDWYYNKVYKNLALDWFVKSPSFQNPDIINKIIIEDKDQIDDRHTEFVESNLHLEFDDKENLNLFVKTLRLFVVNLNTKILEKEFIDLILNKYSKYLVEKVTELNSFLISIIDSLVLASTNKKTLSQIQKLHHEAVALNNKFNKNIAEYSIENINNKFIKLNESIYNIINDFSMLNKKLEIFINQTNEFNCDALNEEQQKEIEKLLLESDPEKTSIKISINDFQNYFLSKVDNNIKEYLRASLLSDVNVFYIKYINSKINEKKKEKQDDTEITVVDKNLEQTFANESKSFRYSTEEVQALYNEILYFNNDKFKNDLMLKDNIFYLNESISKLFIILDYIYNSLKITLIRSRETNIKVVSDKKSRRTIENNIEKSEYYLELLYKQFGVLNNKFDNKNFKNIDVCFNTSKNLLNSFSEFVESSNEFEAFNQFKNLIIQDCEMIKQTLLVYKAMLTVVKDNKNDIHYAMSGLIFDSEKLVDKKQKVRIDYSKIMGSPVNCEDCKESHVNNFFEKSLLADYKKNSTQFKTAVKKIINEVLKVNQSDISSLDAQKFIFNKLVDVITIENGIIKQLGFVANAIGSQISAVMLKNIFNKSSYIIDASNKTNETKLSKYAEILTNNLLILKFLAMKALVLKNLQYHLFLLDKLQNELNTLTSDFNQVDSLFKINMKKIHDLSLLVKEAKLDSSHKNDRNIGYLFCEFVKAGFLPDIKEIKNTNDIVKKLFPDSAASRTSDIEEVINTYSNSNNGGENIEVTYFDNQNPPKTPITYHEFLRNSRLKVFENIKIVNIEGFDEALLNKKDNHWENLDNEPKEPGVTFKTRLEEDKSKDDFICGVIDLYEVKDFWQPSEFKMTMPKYTPVAATKKAPFGFAKKTENK